MNTDHNWGRVEIGDQVTNKGRDGVGQPVIVGQLVRFEPLAGIGVVRLADDTERRRSVRNLRTVTA